MCAPATAALFLAALAALPCKGMDAETTIIKENPKTTSQPIINKVYEMLHASHNHSMPVSFNYSFNDLHSLESSNLKYFPSIIKKETCCDDVRSNSNAMNQRTKRQRRVVNVVKDVVNETVYVEVTTEVSGPMALESRKKPGEAGSSAPLLNYIFDTYSNTHNHRNERPGNGNSIYVAAAPEIEALVGSTAQMDCKVDALHDKLVSWVRRKNDELPMELLTTGTQQYTADDRYSARFIPPDIWRLEVKEVRPSDAAFYDCQLSAHPPRTARVTLRVPEVSVRIVDGAGAEVSEQVCELGSTVALRCEVRGLKMEGGPSLLWYRRDDLLNDDTTRGGISVRTEFGSNGANSVLRVARVRSDDAGRYTCRIARAPPPAPTPAHVFLYVTKGESLAELHQGQDTKSVSVYFVVTLATLLILQTYNII
ncbi:unnamed protein product, partial [Brenthis ino]